MKISSFNNKELATRANQQEVILSNTNEEDKFEFPLGYEDEHTVVPS